MLRLQSREFLQLGLKMTRNHDQMNNKASSKELQRFCAMFGTSPDICSLLWDLLDPTTTMPNNSEDCTLPLEPYVVEFVCIRSSSLCYFRWG